MPPKLPVTSAGSHVNHEQWVVPCDSFLAHSCHEDLINVNAMWTLCKLVHEYIGGLIEIERQSGPSNKPKHLCVHFTDNLLGTAVRIGMTRNKYTGDNPRMESLGPRVYLQGIPVHDYVVRHCKTTNIMSLLNGLHMLLQTHLACEWPRPNARHLADSERYRSIVLSSQVGVMLAVETAEVSPAGTSPSLASPSSEWTVVTDDIEIVEDTD